MAQGAAVHRADGLAPAAATLPRRQASEQNRTSSQFFAQALRQLIGRPQ
jgi:hypothetical protein